jgi:hypothetical protein
MRQVRWLSARVVLVFCEDTPLIRLSVELTLPLVRLNLLRTPPRTMVAPAMAAVAAIHELAPSRT